MAKSSIIAGIIVVAVVGMILIFLILSMITPRTQEPKIDIYEEISILNEGRESWDKYTLHESDWKVWKNQSEALGFTFVEMNNWDEFKENLKQMTRSICIDDENRVIWYGKYLIIYVYY